MIKKKTYIAHHGILGQKWGVRRYQNEDGTLTAEGRERYGYSTSVRYKNNSMILKDKITKQSLKIENVSKEQAKNFNDNIYDKGLNEYLKEGNELVKSMGMKELSMPELLYILDNNEELKYEAAKYIAEYKNKTITEMIEKQYRKN